jgi:hypothetical protein
MKYLILSLIAVAMVGCIPLSKVKKEEKSAKAHLERLINEPGAAAGREESIKFWDGYVTALQVIQDK